MAELFSAYWPVVLVAVIIGLIVGYLIFRPESMVQPGQSQGRAEPLTFTF